MRAVIIGAGPAGLFVGAGLARRGHEVTAVERDPGPAADGSWPRLGVMQFHHAHAFRHQVVQALQQELPDALQRWLAAGAEPVRMRLPDGSEIPMGVRSRRVTFERALRASALSAPGLQVRRGHVEDVHRRHGRAVGVRVDGADLPADLVIDASGRAGRATRSLRPAATSGGPCGIAYVDRQYQLRPGAGPGPLMSPIGWQADLDGYQAIIFIHEHGIFSVLLVRPTADPALSQLRHEAAFTAVCQAIPGLAAWVHPDRSRPITPVLPGGLLLNAYRGQTGHNGRLALPGLVFVGDAVATTTPTFGRGITTTLLQAQQLLRLIDEHGPDTDAIGESFDAWCTEQIKPWVQRPRPHGRIDPPPLGRRGRRPAPIPAVRPHPRCRRGGPRHPRRHRRLPPHDRPALIAARRRAPRTRALRKRLAPAPGTRPGPRRTRRHRAHRPAHITWPEGTTARVDLGLRQVQRVLALGAVAYHRRDQSPGCRRRSSPRIRGEMMK